jgi:hypothetical protein
MDNILEMVEDSFTRLIEEVDTESDSYQIAVVYDDRWSSPLPKEIAPVKFFEGGPPLLIISITGWTREESYFDEEVGGMYIKTAFGDTEYEAVFPAGDIMGLLTEEGVMAYARTYMSDRKEEVVEDNPKREINKEGVEKSMSTMLEMNKHLIGKGKKDGK